MAETIYRGMASDPRELADEIAAMKSSLMRFPYVEPMEVITISMSAANRDLLVTALRALSRPTDTEGE